MASSEVDTAFEDLRRAWWLLFVLGLVSIGFGVLLVFWPGKTLTVVATLVGLTMIVSGVVRFFVAVLDPHREDRWLMVLSGIVGVVIGVVVVRNPEATIALVVLLTGLFWLIGGMVDAFRGITNAGLPDRSLRIGVGVLTALFGVVVLVWPDITIGVFAIITGVYFVMFGVLEAISSFRLRSA